MISIYLLLDLRVSKTAQNRAVSRQNNNLKKNLH